MIISEMGTKSNKTKHQDDQVIEYPIGTKFWFKNGQRHREDGPAIETPDGKNEWWLNGKEYSKAEFRMLQFAKGINIA